MSLNNASVLSGATYVAPTGGSALAFESLGVRNNTNEIFATADTDLRTRRSIVCTVKDPKVSASAPNGYTQARRTATFKSPLSLDNGNVTVNTAKVEFAFDVETTEAELDEMKLILCQAIMDSDFDNFYADGSLA